jgi:hypothetical protein
VGSSDSALSNDRLQRSDLQLGVIWNGNGYGAEVGLPLHHNMASTLADDSKPMLFEDAAGVSSR